MKYIVATSDTPYFRWQMLVQINNFKKLGILDDLTYVVSIANRRSGKLNHIAKDTGVRIETYKDERKNPTYQPSITAHIMKKHLQKYPEEGEMFFYLDPDVIFREKPEYKNIFYLYKSVWFLSDTKSYLDSTYIKSKSIELFNLMCKTVNIDPDLVSKLDKAAGGAQYVMKNVDYDYWNEVEKDSENLYELMSSTSGKYNPEHPIQAWTAEMWAVLWNAWKREYPTLIDEDMNFSWATDPIEKFNKNIIFHNAGVFDQENLFHKGKYNDKHPFNDDHSNVDDKHCSFKYLQEIMDTKNNYPELIKKL